MSDGREHFQKELQKLNDLILKMGGMVEKAIFNSVEALQKNNPKLANEVVAADNQIDKIELAIDDLCLELLATQQPMAMDLRFITSDPVTMMLVSRPTGGAGEWLKEKVGKTRPSQASPDSIRGRAGMLEIPCCRII